MALDRVNHRLFIPAYGNGGFREFQLDEQGLPVDRTARTIIGRESIYGRRSVPVPDERELGFPGATAVFDGSTQRLFGLDRFNNRILVFRAAPEQVDKYPAATVVIGQPDFRSTARGMGPNRFGMVSDATIDEEGQRLFVADAPNSRVLVFDIHPDRLDIDPRATVVLGQPDFKSRTPGLGPNRFMGAGSVAYDPVFKRLFVSDMGNNRVLVFNADSKVLKNNAAAIAVMGQPDFQSRRPRQSLDELKPESLAYDWVNHRLFISEDLQHRIMVYDAHPDRIGGPAKAIAVVGQPNTHSTQPAVSRNRLAMPRLAVDPISQKLYVSEGFPAGNRISVWDIKPGNLKTGMAASDVIGHQNPEGGPDFEQRMAQGRLDGQSLAAARALVLDPVDHRLFVADEYNHRVVVWQLDDFNRVSDRAAHWVLGQPDLRSSLMGEPSATNMTVPLAVAYDSATKRLFAGDGYHNRILVYEAAPGKLASGMAASVVLGQKDFKSVVFAAGRSGLNFDVRMGRGIASNFLPMGLAVDESGQRLFVSDGENNRVLVYDISVARLRNEMPAAAVIGQPDFTSTKPGGGATGFHDPGHLAYDPNHQRLFVVDAKNRRVLVFDVDPQRLENGESAIAVLGSPGFETRSQSGPRMPGLFLPPGMMGGAKRQINGRSLFSPNGIAYDPQQDILYVADGGGTIGVAADRVLAFRVGPGELHNGAEAFAVLGATDAAARSPRSFGGPKSYPGQFTLRDARGITLDAEHGRLFVSGSFASRVVVFNFPRSDWEYKVGGQGIQLFNTPDATDLGVRSEPLEVESLKIKPQDRGPSAVAVVSLTQMFVDERTQRHSRMLLSEAAIPASRAVIEASLFLDGAPNRKHRLALYNPGKTASSVSLTLQDRRGKVQGEWARQVSPGRQQVFTLEELGTAIGRESTLRLSATQPIAVVAFRQTKNKRDDWILSPAPMVFDEPTEEKKLLPLIANGGGRQSQVILMNNSGEEMRGSVIFYDRQGGRAPLGADSEVMPYVIPPRSSRLLSTDGAGPITGTGYAVIASQSGPAPSAAALIRSRSGDVWKSESLVEASRTLRARIPVQIQPTLIRHGDIDTLIFASNAEPRSAHIRFSFGDAATVHRTLGAGRQIVVSVRDLFGEEVRGLVTVDSDSAIGVSARQRTINLRGESIVVGLPSLEDDSGLFFPYVPNGGGFSTELRLLNPSPAVLSGTLEFHLPDGKPATGTILR